MSELNPNAKLWVEDLKTTDAKQGQTVLHIKNNDDVEDEFCCLGRACVIYNLHNPNDLLSKMPTRAGSLNIIAYDNSRWFLPSKVTNWLGLSQDSGTYEDENTGTILSLVKLNDEGKTFKEIAEVIESMPKGLFIESPQITGEQNGE